LGTCTLYLPKSSPVQIVNIEGEVSILKKAVCLKACRELHAIGALTDHLLPELGFPCEEEPDIGMVQGYSCERIFILLCTVITLFNMNIYMLFYWPCALKLL
jgi:endoribonuclease Dicer